MLALRTGHLSCHEPQTAAGTAACPADYLGIPAEPYASLESIQKELRHSQQVRVSHGWRQIDVTGKSVEELAREIVVLLPAGDQRRKPGLQG